MALFKKRISAIGLAQLIYGSFLDKFSSNFPQVMSHFKINENDYNQFHVLEVFSCYLFVIYNALLRRYDQNIVRLIVDVIRENFMKQCDTKDHYVDYTCYVENRVKEYLGICGRPESGTDLFARMSKNISLSKTDDEAMNAMRDFFNLFDFATEFLVTQKLVFNMTGDFKVTSEV